jgi:hypothetical protein
MVDIISPTVTSFLAASKSAGMRFTSGSAACEASVDRHLRTWSSLRFWRTSSKRARWRRSSSPEILRAHPRFSRVRLETVAG